MAFAAVENPAERQTSKAALASSGRRREVDVDVEEFPFLPLPFEERVTLFKKASSRSPSRRAA